MSTNSKEIIENLIRASECGMNWMDQVSRARLGSATLGILKVDMGMCSLAIESARKYLEINHEPTPIQQPAIRS